MRHALARQQSDHPSFGAVVQRPEAGVTAVPDDFQLRHDAALGDVLAHDQHHFDALGLRLDALPAQLFEIETC